MPDATSITSRIKKDGHCIATLEDWFKHAPPQAKESHWKNGRSAKEFARVWVDAAPNLPLVVAGMLKNSPDFETLRSWWAEPEAKVKFDNYRGPANLDLLLVGNDDTGPLIIAVEAKADETFGEPVEKTLEAAGRRLEQNPNAKGVARLEELAELFGLALDRPDFLALRYQLLTLTAAAMSITRCRSAKRALVIIHEFVTPLTDEERRRQNGRDLDTFLQSVFGWADPLVAGKAIGPLEVEHMPRLYFGKIQTTIGTR